METIYNRSVVLLREDEKQCVPADSGAMESSAIDPPPMHRETVRVGSMHYMTVTECRITLGRMQDFVAQVQQWEQDAQASANAPEFHGVYLQEADPSRVLLVTQFGSREAAEAFAASGLAERFRDRVLTCTDTPPGEPEGFDLFYASLADGSRVIFGQDG